MTNEFEGRHVVVTGGTGALGGAVVAQFLARVAHDASVLGTCRGATGDTRVITSNV